MINKQSVDDLDIIIPVAIELDWPTVDSTVSDILEQYHNYGFKRFCLAAPCGGWRSVGYPPKEQYEKLAKFFAQVKTQVAPYGIECVWWNTLTIKSGPSEEFNRMVKMNGTDTPFSSCPLNPVFRKRFSEDIALFIKIAKPAETIFEDDYAIGASTYNGCFCQYHLEEFAKREGVFYSREELIERLTSKTPENLELFKRWRELQRDSLVGLAECIRKEVDKESPEANIGYMQSGAVYMDGDTTEMIARALAGPRHVPFSRIFGTFYCNAYTKKIPERLYNVLYSKQHIKEPFKFYHESDTYPHTRYGMSAAQMRAMMATAYSYGYDGSTFQTQQLLDNPNEETCFGKMFAKERTRMNAMHRIAKQCEVKGVELHHDPFWNTVDEEKSTPWPLWITCVSLFGIPYTTVESEVAFWDDRQAKYADHETIMKYLSKGLFLDADAAKVLCSRGYGEYLGVEIGENVAEGMYQYDLGSREVIRQPFVSQCKGRNMVACHLFNLEGTNGFIRKVTVTDPDCEVVSELYTFQKKYICPVMTRFENKLGGRVVVMSITMDHNEASGVYNYRRKHLLQELVTWCNDRYVYEKEEPRVFVVMNEATDSERSGFKGMLTIINLADDANEKVVLHIPAAWNDVEKFLVLNESGEWVEPNYTKEGSTLVIHQELRYCDPMYILAM